MVKFASIQKTSTKKVMSKDEKLGFHMDIIAAHLDVGLDFESFSKDSGFNFVHDCVGIRDHMNRKTGKLGNRFLPRFADESKRPK